MCVCVCVCVYFSLYTCCRFNQTKVSASKSNIQGGGWKFQGHFVRYFRSRIPSDSSKQGHKIQEANKLNLKKKKKSLSHLGPSVCVSSFLQIFDLDLVCERVTVHTS